MPERAANAPSAGPFAVLGDQPAAPGEDRLGFERFAGSLARRLLTSVEHTPFTVGVLGDWGQGKTTVMRMLQARLDAEGCPTVWFEPWKYNDRDGVWKGLALTLVREIKARDSLVREIRRKQGALKNFLGGFLWSRLIGNHWGEKLVQAATSEPWSAASLHEMERTLDDLFGLADPAEQGRPVVLFVDDLDRCLPEAARSVLEAVKLVLARKGLITVMGIAEGELSRAVHAAYAESMRGRVEDIDPEWGRKYIRKIIQMPFPVPQMSQVSFEEYVGHCLEASGIGAVLGDRPEWRSVVREACGGNLREVKRFLNHFISEMDKAAANLEALTDEGRSSAIDVTASPARVAFILLLGWGFRDFYRHLRTTRRRDILVRYQLAFKWQLRKAEGGDGSQLSEDQAGLLKELRSEFLEDAALAQLFHLCFSGADARAPLVSEFRDWKDLLPYLQFGSLPTEEGPEEMKPEAVERDLNDLSDGEDASTFLGEGGQEDSTPHEQPIDDDQPDAIVEQEAEDGAGKTTWPYTIGSLSADANESHEEGQSLLASGRYEEAEHRLRRAIRRARKAEDPAGQSLLKRLLAEVFQREARLEEAISLLQDSVALSEESGDPLDYLESLILLAETYRQTGRVEDALEAADSAVGRAVELGDPLLRSRALGAQAAVLEGLGQLEEAQKLLEEILDLAEELTQPTLEGEVLLRLAMNLLQQGKIQAAEGELKQALELARKIGQTDLEASALSVLGEIDEQRGDVEAALQKQEMAVELRRKAGDGEGGAVAQTRLAELLTKLGRFDEAVKIVRAVRSRFVPPVVIQDAELLETLGRHLLDLDEHDEARELLMEALQRYQEQGAAEKELEIGKLLMF